MYFFFIVLVYRITNKIPGAQVVNFKISPKHKDTVFTNVQSSHLGRWNQRISGLNKWLEQLTVCQTS